MVRKIQAKLVLRLHGRGLSGRAIARSQGMSRRSVADVLYAAKAAGIGWELMALFRSPRADYPTISSIVSPLAAGWTAALVDGPPDLPAPPKLTPSQSGNPPGNPPSAG